MDNWAELVARVRVVRTHAYALYSGYAVVGAVRADDGSIHVGCNVENVAFPEGLRAEAAAIAAMPCGCCRQKLMEFAAPGTEVAIADGGAGPVRRLRLDARCYRGRSSEEGDNDHPLGS